MMMKKTLGILALFVVLLSGCENNSGSKQPEKQTVSLTQEELLRVQNSPNEAAPLLVKKAVLKEMDTEKLTPEETKQIEEIKQNVAIDYFLNKKAAESVFIAPEEAETIYKENAKSFKNMTKEQAVAAINNQLFYQRREAEKTRYLNILVKKYNLNEKLNEIFVKQDDTQKNQAVDTNKKEK